MDNKLSGKEANAQNVLNHSFNNTCSKVQYHRFFDGLSLSKEQEEILSIFTAMIRNSDSVSVFSGKPGCQLSPLDGNWIEGLAVSMACDTLSRVNDSLGFHASVKSIAARKHWTSQLLNSSNDSGLKICLKYIGANRGMGKTNTEAVEQCLEKLQIALSGKASSTTFCDFFTDELFLKDIMEVLYTNSRHFEKSEATGGTKCIIKYGDTLCEWILNGSGKDYYNGREIHNTRLLRPPACFLPSTLITLYDGNQMAIRDINAGMEILSKDSTKSISSSEHSIIKSSDWGEIVLYGFICEDIENGRFMKINPFFTSVQRLFTQDGWKSLAGDAAGTGRLREGDLIFLKQDCLPGQNNQARTEKGHSPRSCRIASFLSITSVEELHYIHLYEGHPSFFANGILMGMDCSTITESSLLSSIVSLSKNEKRYVSESLQPILPFLADALGGFVSQPLKRILKSGGKIYG